MFSRARPAAQVAPATEGLDVVFEEMDLTNNSGQNPLVAPALSPALLSAPKTAAAAPQETVIGTDAVFQGEIKSQDTVRIAGTFLGHVEAPQVRIDRGGYIHGTIASDILVIGGRFQGSAAANSIKILASGITEGHLAYGEIDVDAGADLGGTLERRAPVLADTAATLEEAERAASALRDAQAALSTASAELAEIANSPQGAAAT